MIRHVVTWRVNGEDAAARAAQAAVISEQLTALASRIPEIVSLRVGTNVAYPDANWDVVLIGDYASLADLEAYQVHPDHVAAALVIRQLVASRAAVDFEL